MTASEESVGLKRETISLTLLEEPFELRIAYILEMTPTAAGFRIAVFCQFRRISTFLQCPRRLRVATGSETHVNLEAQHKEIWIRDPDGFVVFSPGRTANLNSWTGKVFWDAIERNFFPATAVFSISRCHLR